MTYQVIFILLQNIKEYIKLQGNNLNNSSGICADTNELSKKAFKVFDRNRDGKITKKVFLNS